MDLETKIIWSKTYSKPDPMAVLEEAPPYGPDPSGWEPLEERLARRDPEKYTQAQIMVDQVVELAEVYAIDTCVEEGPGFLKATLYVKGVFFSGGLTEDLLEILKGSSLFTVDQDPERGPVMEIACFISR